MLSHSFPFRVLSKNACRIIPYTITQKRYIQQKRFPDWKKLEKHPWDQLEEFKEKMANIPRLDDVPPMKPITVQDRIEESNYRMIKYLKDQGKYPLEAFVEEEPTLQETIDWMKQPRPKPGDWTPKAVRARCLAVKVGMFPMYDEYFERNVVTCLYIPQCQVVQVKTEEKEGYNALQIGAGPVKIKNVNKPLMGHFNKAGVPPKQVLYECKVTRDCMLPVGFEITARHYIPGMYVDVIGTSKGKGFQGPMKRHGFAGLPASHGVSVSHRSHGSIGVVGQSKVWKGKKMAGRMGGKTHIQRNLMVYAIDIVRNCIFVLGSVPGAKGSYVAIRDSRDKPPSTPPPYPGFIPPKDEDLSKLSFVESMLIAKKKMPQDFLAEMHMTIEEYRDAVQKSMGNEEGLTEWGKRTAGYHVLSDEERAAKLLAEKEKRKQMKK